MTEERDTELATIALRLYEGILADSKRIYANFYPDNVIDLGMQYYSFDILPVNEQNVIKDYCQDLLTDAGFTQITVQAFNDLKEILTLWTEDNKLTLDDDYVFPEVEIDVNFDRRGKYRKNKEDQLNTSEELVS